MTAPPSAYRLKLTEQTAAFIRSLHPDIKKKIRAGIEIIMHNPQRGKQLRQELARLCSFRVGKFRIVYRLASKTVIELVAAGPRKTMYEETYKLLMREKQFTGWVGKETRK
ncbi:MAG: type II toxin-antitoxin system RelE/ParE family toxin [Deltaproteobacteria bacterium]|nr:type II toxin-antitoxin system RelE/ParE family toxin [Deltaproteobacteria bacterium]